MRVEQFYQFVREHLAGYDRTDILNSCRDNADILSALHTIVFDGRHYTKKAYLKDKVLSSFKIHLQVLWCEEIIGDISNFLANNVRLELHTCTISTPLRIENAHSDAILNIHNCHFTKSVQILNSSFNKLVIGNSIFHDDLFITNVECIADLILDGDFKRLGLKQCSSPNSRFSGKQHHDVTFQSCNFKTSLISFNKSNVGVIFSDECSVGDICFKQSQISLLKFTNCQLGILSGEVGNFNELNLDSTRTLPGQEHYLIDLKKNASMHKLRLTNSNAPANILGTLALTTLEIRNANIQSIAVLSIEDKLEISDNSQIFNFNGEKAEIGETLISNSTVHVFNCNSSKFKSISNFEKVTFLQAPSFYNADLYKGTHFKNCIFKDYSDKSIGLYRVLKEVMGENKNERDEALFGALELSAIHKNLIIRSPETFFEKSTSYISYAMNGYGTSLLKPFAWLFSIVLITTFTMSTTDSFAISQELTSSEFTSTSHKIAGTWIAHLYEQPRLIQALALSIITALGPIKFLMDKQIFYASSIYSQFFLLLMGILSSILWYLGITGIKRRFRQS